MGAIECIKVSQKDLELGTANTSTESGNYDNFEISSAIESDNQVPVFQWLPFVLIAWAAGIVLCGVVICGLFVWHQHLKLSQQQSASTKQVGTVDKMLNSTPLQPHTPVLVQMEGKTPSPSDSDFRGKKKAKHRLELRKGLNPLP